MKETGTTEACKATWGELKMAALDVQNVPVLFMLAAEKIQANVEYGSDINDLLKIAGNIFKVSTSSLTLQSYDNEWEEWVNLSPDFIATRRIKLKVVCKFGPSKSNCGDSKTLGFKQTTLKAGTDKGLLVLDKNKTAKEVQPYEVYLHPNPHTERLQFYNNVTPVLYNESFKEFSSIERFQNYLITERRWRFDVESKLNSITEKVTDITTNCTNQSNGTAYNIQRLQKIPPDASSNDVSRGERALSALETMKSSCEALYTTVLEKKKACYLPSMDLMPGAKSTLEFIQIKIDALDKLKSTLFSLLDNVNGVLNELCRRYSRQTSSTADAQRQKRRQKEQRRKNKNKKMKVRGRQVNEVCELLISKRMNIDINNKASEAIINSGNISKEALHNKMRKRFHLEPLKDLVKQGYVSACVLPDVEEAIHQLESSVTEKPLKAAKGKQMTLSRFFSVANTHLPENDGSDSASSTESNCDSDGDQESDEH